MRRARAFAVPRSCIPSGRAPSVLAAAALVALCTVARAADDTTWDVPVQRGDTLIGITARLLAPGSDWRVLQRVNRVRDPRRLPIGRVLHIPVALLREQAETAEVLHAHGDVQVERAGSGFATTWGSIAGQLLFPLVLMLPPFNALAIGLIERLTAGTVADPRMVTVAMAFAFGSVVLLQSIATLMLHVIWVASKR